MALTAFRIAGTSPALSLGYRQLLVRSDLPTHLKGSSLSLACQPSRILGRVVIARNISDQGLSRFAAWQSVSSPFPVIWPFYHLERVGGLCSFFLKIFAFIRFATSQYTRTVRFREPGRVQQRFAFCKTSYVLLSPLETIPENITHLLITAEISQGQWLTRQVYGR